MQRWSTWIGAAALAAGAAAFGGEAVVERGDLTLRFDRRARVEPAQRRAVRFEPEVYSGRLELADRARVPGPVAEGDELLRLRSREFDEQFEDAKTLAAEAERRLEVTRSERRIAVEQARVGLERAEFAAEVAQRAWDLFQRFDSAKILEQREIGLQWSRDALKDERTELEQLEKMYQGTSLADETKDLVLNRARRSLARNERMLKHSEQDHRNFIEYLHPQTTRQMEDAAKFAAFDLEVARTNARLTAVRAELDLASAERAARDARRRAERLERDGERMVIRAPAAGYWTPAVREAFDPVQPWQSLGEISNLSEIRLKGTLDPLALRVLGAEAGGAAGVIGASLDVRFPSRPELRATATISEFTAIGSPEGDSTSFSFVASLDRALLAQGLFAGMEAIALGERTLKGVLLVPEKAVSGGPARPVVKRKGDDGETTVPVRVGPTVEGRTVILEGLSEGDRVVVPDG